MKINKVLDELFRTQSNIAVIRALENYRTGITGREAARRSGLAPKNCLITLTALEELGVVNRVRGGRDHLFSLNRAHYLMKEILGPVLEQERNFPEEIFRHLAQKAGLLAVSIYLFGSAARGEDVMGSDLDLCIIYSAAKSKSALEERFSELSYELRSVYGVAVSPFYISEKEFIRRARKNISPVVEILKDGKYISGKKIKGLLKDENGRKKAS